MTQHISKFLWLLFIIAISGISCKESLPKDCEAITISPVSNQKMYENTRIYIPIAAMSNNLDELRFEVTGASFMANKTTQRGRCQLTLDPATEDVGKHNITIEVTDGSKYGCLEFEVEVKTIDKSKRIIHCKPNQNQNDPANNTYPSLSILLENGFQIANNDIIILHNGNHGNILISGENYNIVSSSNEVATVSGISIQNTHNITVSGLKITPSITTGLHDKYLLHIDSLSSSITISNSIVSSIKNSQKWSLEQWNDSAARGIKCLGNNCTIQNNTIQNVFHGIKTEGQNIIVSYNHVDRFGGDAIRNTGSSNSFSYNFLTNATVDDYYAKNGNHDDLFQSWTFDKSVNNIKLDHNIMISCLDTLMPFRAKIVQGLVCFDGFETNWLVQHNLVVTDHPHGIALYGAKNCTITKNTVLKNPYDLYKYESDPWIMVNNHKDGRKSKNNTVKNNITSALNIVAGDVHTSNNIVIDSLKRQDLNNYYDWDFRFKK